MGASFWGHFRAPVVYVPPSQDVYSVCLRLATGAKELLRCVKPLCVGQEPRTLLLPIHAYAAVVCGRPAVPFQRQL